MAETGIPTTPCIETEISGKIQAVGEQSNGKDVTFNLSITNLTTDAKVITADIEASSILYTRTKIHEIFKERRNISLQGCEVKEVPLTVPYAQYDGLLTADNAIEMTVICSYAAVHGTLIIQTNTVLSNPKFEIKLKGPAHINKPFKAEVVFTNPLNKEISDIEVTAEGSGLFTDPVKIKAGPVKPKETIVIPLTITPNKQGSRHLLVDLNSRYFYNLKGFAVVEVQQQDEKTSESLHS